MTKLHTCYNCTYDDHLGYPKPFLIIWMWALVLIWLCSLFMYSFQYFMESCNTRTLLSGLHPAKNTRFRQSMSSQRILRSKECGTRSQMLILKWPPQTFHWWDFSARVNLLLSTIHILFLDANLEIVQCDRTFVSGCYSFTSQEIFAKSVQRYYYQEYFYKR